MAKLSQQYRIVLPVVVLALAFTASAPTASVHTACGASAACTSGAGTCSASSKSTTGFYNTQTQQSSPESSTGVLESPINLFKNIFGSDRSDEDEQEVAPQAGTLVLAIKALAATLLSTII